MNKLLAHGLWLGRMIRTGLNNFWSATGRREAKAAGLLVVAVLHWGVGLSDSLAEEYPSPREAPRDSIIPILGTTFNEDWEQVGIVANVHIQFIRREDHRGLDIRFHTSPGRFSLLAQRSVEEAIKRVAGKAGLDTNSWTLRFTLPYPGVTLYGESLSAMSALRVIALAKGDPVHEDIVMTGTVTSEGSIGIVGGIPLKILAAHEQHFKRVLIPEEQDVADGDWQTPFLMQVSPMRSVQTAYRILTDRPLLSSPLTGHRPVNLASR